VVSFDGLRPLLVTSHCSLLANKLRSFVLSPKCTKCRLAVGLRLNPLGELKSPRAPSRGWGGAEIKKGRGKRTEKKRSEGKKVREERERKRGREGKLHTRITTNRLIWLNLVLLNKFILHDQHKTRNIWRFDLFQRPSSEQSCVPKDYRVPAFFWWRPLKEIDSVIWIYLAKK